MCKIWTRIEHKHLEKGQEKFTCQMVQSSSSSEVNEGEDNSKRKLIAPFLPSRIDVYG